MVLFSALLMSSAAFATEIEVTAKITDLDGKVITVDGKPDGAPLTLRTVAEVALLGSYEDERMLSGDKKADRYALAQKIHDTDTLDLKAEDVALLKLLIGKDFGPLIVGRALALVDPPAAKK